MNNHVEYDDVTDIKYIKLYLRNVTTNYRFVWYC